MRIFKYLGVTLALLLLLIAAGLGAAWVVWPNKKAPPSDKVESTPDRVARGKYVAEHVAACFVCHSDRDFAKVSRPQKQGQQGSGGQCDEGPGYQVCPANITPAMQTGIGHWTDGEIIRAIREGIGKDGNALWSGMPYGEYRQLSDDDVQAVVTYLRSLPLVERQIPEMRVSLYLTLVNRTLPQPVEQSVVAPAKADQVAYGQYLVRVARCTNCHMENFAGGIELPGPNGRSVSANITPDRETGIGSWSREQFVGRFKAFATLDPTAPATPGQTSEMPWTDYSGMTEEDLGAMFAFLMTVPPVSQKVVRFPDAVP